MGIKRTTKSVKRARKVKNLPVKAGQAKKVKGGPGGYPWRRNLDGTASKSS